MLPSVEQVHIVILAILAKSRNISPVFATTE
ncbi:hypothetical protein VINI7043_04620 [Vibrio nigripulchritudo ATCC 27043]|nr:hypothetical protein VINI7043_04620 [Vibrio nigripulchritudo ATCC 27043]